MPQVTTVAQKQKEFTADELNTWTTILKDHNTTREHPVVDIFHQGLKVLGIQANKPPNMEAINTKLRALTGFQGVLVDGLEDGNSFYSMLSKRQFPIGNFIRDKNNLSYTPEPDIVHDL